MKAIAIGVSLMFLLSVVRGKGMTFSGLPSIILGTFIAWGLGTLVLAILH